MQDPSWHVLDDSIEDSKIDMTVVDVKAQYLKDSNVEWWRAADEGKLK
jgi:hypothetical protein